jgi:hypothetical protein
VFNAGGLGVADGVFAPGVGAVTGLKENWLPGVGVLVVISW